MLDVQAPSLLHSRVSGSLARPASCPPTAAQAAAGVPLRTLQEWMGHRDYKTTLIYADYAPRTHEKALMERAFQRDPLDFRRHETFGPAPDDSGREGPEDGDAER